MKIWYAHGSEHSANLVMIGRFKSAADAARAKQTIDSLAGAVNAEFREGSLSFGSLPERFSEKMRELLEREKIYSIAPHELEQFAEDVNVNHNGTEVKIGTDEIEVSAFMKVLIDRGAKLEIYSAHSYPDEGK